MKARVLWKVGRYEPSTSPSKKSKESYRSKVRLGKLGTPEAE